MFDYERHEELKKEFVEEWYGDGYDPDDFVYYEAFDFKELGEMLIEEDMIIGLSDWVITYLDFEKLGRDYYLESDAVHLDDGKGFLFYYG